MNGRVNGYLVLAILLIVVIVTIIFVAATYRDSSRSRSTHILETNDREKNGYRCTGLPLKIDSVYWKLGNSTLFVECAPEGQSLSYDLYASTTPNFNPNLETEIQFYSLQSNFSLSRAKFCGSVYYFRIRGVNACGKGAFSDAFSVNFGNPTNFKICAAENPDLCINGTADPGNSLLTLPFECSLGGCIWHYVDLTGQIILRPYNDICLYQNGSDLDTRLCIGGPAEEFEIDIDNQSICNIDSGDCFKSLQNMDGETQAAGVTLGNNDSSSKYKWTISCSGVQQPL